MSSLSDQLNASLAGRYAVERELGSGGMARVFLAQDSRHSRSVAIKVVRPELASVLGGERFLREIEFAAGLHHPHILPLYDSGSAGGLLYYVMPYSADGSLRQRLARDKQLPLADALYIAHQLADALDHAHRHGVIHRDIKPENILLAGRHVWVADFGIARAIEVAGGEKLTETGIAIGTPAYMSPEQTTASRDLDARSDQYSLGCVLYEMLAGQPPFVAPTAQILAHQHLNVAPRPVTDLRPAVAREVAVAIGRALAKVAADRFPTTAEFAAALDRPAVMPPPVAGDRRTPGSENTTTIEISTAPPGRDVPVRPHWIVRWRAPLIGTLAVLVITLAAWRFLPRLFPDRDSTATKKGWVLVAEFDGPADDREVLLAAREMVNTALEESEVVSAVPRAQLQEALRLAGRADTSRVGGDLARELANRSSIPAVIEGRISRVGSARIIVLRAVSAEDGSTFFSATETAKSLDDLIPTLGRLSQRLRKRLGENPAAIQATRRLIEAATPSYEAFRMYARGVELYQEADLRGCLESLAEALRIDPEFAAAWMLRGWAYGNLGMRDSMVVAFDQAKRFHGRLTETQRLFANGMTAWIQGDLAGADAIWMQLIRRDPNDANALGNHAGILGETGQYEAALDCVRRAAKLAPVAPSHWMLNGIATYSLKLGHPDGASDALQLMKSSNVHYWNMTLAAAADDWARADSLAAGFVSDPAMAAEVRIPGHMVIAARHAAAGAMDEAGRELLRGQAAGIAARRIDWAMGAAQARALLALTHGTSPGTLDPEIAGDTTTIGLVTRGMWALAAGNRDPADRIVRGLRRRPASELARHGAGPTLIEAWTAGSSGRWDEAVRILAPAARQGDELGSVTYMIGRIPMRWLVASAYEHLGQADSAAIYYELTLRPEGAWEWERPMLRMVSSMAHQRLVLIYARMGRAADAERHWRSLTTAVHRPDATVRPRIEEARVALSKVR